MPYFHGENSYLWRCRGWRVDEQQLFRQPDSAHALDKGDFVDLLQGGKTAAHLVECRLAQEAHAVFAGGAPYFRSWLPIQNHLADAVGQIQKLVNCGSSPESGSSALDAALPFV